MKFSTLALLATSIVSIFAEDSDWVTYTKNLGYKTITVTKYLGTAPLTGTEYTTKTIPVTDSDGNTLYTEIVTAHADVVSSSSSAAAASSDPEWVTYTKDLGSTTIIVTRYVGTTPLSGPQYTTKTVVKTDSDGNPKYTEIITGFADPVSSSSAAPAVVETSSGYTNNTEATTSYVTVNEESTTVITVTSCDSVTCSEVPVTTGVTVGTSTMNGVVTEYTTYCSLSSTAGGAGEASAEGESTETVKVYETQTVGSESSTAAVLTYEGAANAVGLSFGIFVAGAVALLI